MGKYPPELLHKIFTLLNLKQRLICLTVCRSWWKVLDKRSLFYNVKIKEETDRFKRVMHMFEQSPASASQVEESSITTNIDSLFTKGTLLDTFPNARVIRVKKSELFDIINKVPIDGEVTDTLTSKSRVEYLSDFNSCDLISQLIYSNLGGRLQTLDLDFAFASSKSTIVSQLKDLPVLKKNFLFNFQ
jgi:hypothetical protein